MANSTLQDVFDAARGYLHDTQISGGENWTNTKLQIHFNESWRRMWRAISGGGSKRVERFVYVNLPATTTVLVPGNFNITDFSEPVYIEERLAPSALTIASTDTSSPIQVTITAHGLGSAGTQGYGIVSGVAGTGSPWGLWGFTVIDANTISLNGSASDGNAGTGGVFTVNSTARWSEVVPADLAGQCVDGTPTGSLGCYLWQNEQLIFRGCVNTQQLRITYWSSGTPPTLANQHLGIDDSVDLLACVTAANAAASVGWYPHADRLLNKAFGPSQDPDILGGLLLEFINLQVKSQQRGPSVRNRPFRRVRTRFGAALIGG